MNNPKISVIVPVYNVEKYLSECLDSIINQTLKEIEIICVNDGSKDNSLSILKEYASKDKRIKIIDKENEGLGYTRKVGLENANGEYILFCDSDDYYAELTAFEELYNHIEKLKVDVVIFGFIQKNEIDNLIDYRSNYNIYPQKEVFSYLDIDNIFLTEVMTWLKIYSKKFLDNYDNWYFPKHTFYEDNPFHYQILFRSKLSYLNKYFYVYRIRQNSIMTIKNNEKKISDSLKIFKEINFVLKDKYKNIQFLNYFYNLLSFRTLDYQIKKVKTIKYIIDIIKQFDIYDLFKITNREEFFIFRASLRMTPEQYMEYFNRKILKNANKQIKYRDNIVKNLDKAVKERDSIIKNLDNAVKYRDNIIKNLDNAVKHRDDIIKNLDNAVKHRDNLIKKLDDAVKHRDNLIKNI